jgi:hypothetical protein
LPLGIGTGPTPKNEGWGRPSRRVQQRGGEIASPLFLSCDTRSKAALKSAALRLNLSESADAIDARAEAAQFLFDALVAAVDVVNAINVALTLGHECG